MTLLIMTTLIMTLLIIPTYNDFLLWPSTMTLLAMILLIMTTIMTLLTRLLKMTAYNAFIYNDITDNT